MGFQAISRIDMTGVYPAPVVTGPAPALSSMLMLSPSKREYNGIVYDMTEQGLYSFFNAGYLGVYDGAHKIVAAAGANCAVERLMAALAWLTRYGREDEGYTPAQLTASIIRLRTAALRCEFTINWAQSICAALGVATRKVRFITAEPWNGIDDGHVAMEVSYQNGWRLFDVAGDVCFRDPVIGNLLSMREVVDVGVTSVTTQQIAPTESAPTNWSGSQLQTEQYFNQVFRFGAAEWRRRMYQCAGIDHQGEVWWKVPAAAPGGLAAQIEALQSNYRVKSHAVWNATFYGG